jgi:chromosome segregation ATPase
VVFRLVWIFCFLPAIVHAQVLPEYKSTDNTGKGRQERFEAIENYLIQIGNYSQELEQRLKKEDDSTLKNLVAEQENLKKQYDQLRQENTSIREEMTLLRQAIGSLSQTDFQKIEDFIKKMEDGEWDQVKDGVETLKLEMRSIEAIIQTLQTTTSR